MSELKWYIVKAVSGQEKKVKAYLDREILKDKNKATRDSLRLSEKIVEVLVPSEKVYQVRKSKDGKSKKIAVEKTYFPGYVIIQAELNGEIIHAIKSVPGVLGFLDVDGAGVAALPKPMREAEVNRMLGKVEGSDDNEVKHEVKFFVGETVKVMDGPFNGFTGVVEEVFEEKKKLNVMVKIFGRNAPVELNYIQVSKEE